MPTSTINTGTEVSTLVNVFVVDPAQQQRLVDILVEATETVMRHLPGFISANIHASDDGTRVVNYAQWASAERFQDMLGDPRAQEHMTAAAEIATSYDPHLYRVIAIHHAAT